MTMARGGAFLVFVLVLVGVQRFQIEDEDDKNLFATP
jgi:hypothetical protein